MSTKKMFLWKNKKKNQYFLVEKCNLSKGCVILVEETTDRSLGKLK